MKKHNAQEIIGQRFNKLTVQSFAEYRGHGKSKASYYFCLCDCGNRKIIRLTDFKTGRTISCGCAQKRTASLQGKASKLPIGESPTNTLFAQYRKSAENRNITFHLSKELFKVLIKENCYYCGKPPSAYCRSRHYPDTDFIIYNGIDRKNNQLGYVESNCVACCGSCNYAKSDLSEKEFLDKVAKIYNNRICEISQHRNHSGDITP